MLICLPVAVDVVTNVQSLAAHNLVVLSLVLAQNLVLVLSHVAQNHAVLSLAAQNHAVLSHVAQNHAHVLSLAAKHAANLYVVVETDAVLAADVTVTEMETVTTTKKMDVKFEEMDVKSEMIINLMTTQMQRSQLQLLNLIQEALTKSFSRLGRLSHHAELLA